MSRTFLSSNIITWLAAYFSDSCCSLRGKLKEYCVINLNNFRALAQVTLCLAKVVENLALEKLHNGF